jgi:hypothetical protein
VVDDLFGNAVLPWILGAMMLACGLVIIGFHQYWYSASAVVISLFGWFVALRGLALVALPTEIESGATETLSRPGLLLGARIFFLALTAVGLWLTTSAGHRGAARSLWITSAPRHVDLSA